MNQGESAVKQSSSPCFLPPLKIEENGEKKKIDPPKRLDSGACLEISLKIGLIEKGRARDAETCLALPLVCCKIGLIEKGEG